MLKTIRIQNYKSILDDTIELGRINVFIGENGCGKSNLLEAVAMGAAALNDELEGEKLFNRGVRVAKTALTTSAFADVSSGSPISLKMREDSDSLQIDFVESDDESLGDWLVALRSDTFMVSDETPRARGLAPGKTKKLVDLLKAAIPSAAASMSQVKQLMESLDSELVAVSRFAELLAHFVIFNLNAPALRGIQVLSRRDPLGIHGEGLDAALASLGDEQRRDLTERARCIGWLEDFVLDLDDRLKLQGFKPGRSTSTLYFVDKYLAAGNNIFSAENANEGILHVLFYLALMIHPGAPKVFGIDNIETALNPQLCRDLMKQLAELAKAHDRQALITTHNPAILDGMNLHDDDQRLFVVERNEEGHTKTRRIRQKPDTGEEPRLKLSELWMRGYLGGLPRGF